MLPMGCELVHRGSTPRLQKKGNLSLRPLSGPLGSIERLCGSESEGQAWRQQERLCRRWGAGVLPGFCCPHHAFSPCSGPQQCAPSFFLPACLSTLPSSFPPSLLFTFLSLSLFPFFLPSLLSSFPPSLLPPSLPFNVSFSLSFSFSFFF